MKPNDTRRRIVNVTDPAEIASIERNGTWDLIGGKDAHGYWSYSDHLQQYRERQAQLEIAQATL